MHTIFLSSLGTTALYSLVGLLIGLLLIATIVLMKPMPKNAKYAAMGILTAVLGLFTLTLYQSYNSQIHWDHQQVVFDVPLYGQSLSPEDIFLQQAYLADLNQQTELQPKWRSNGMGLPGYSLGWFKLNNGDKALLSITEQQEVIVIPTNQGYSIMVSVEQPQEALEKLHAADAI